MGEEDNTRTQKFNRIYYVNVLEKIIIYLTIRAKKLENLLK